MAEPEVRRSIPWVAIAVSVGAGRLLLALVSDTSPTLPRAENALWTLPVDMIAGLAEILEQSAAASLGSAKLLAALLGSLAFAAALAAVGRL